MIIQGLWYRQAESIIDIKLREDDTYFYQFDPMAALLYWWEKINKDKQDKHFHYQHKHFSLFILSVDGMIVK